MVYLLMASLGVGGCVYAIVRSNRKAGLLSVYLVAWALVTSADWWAHSILVLYRFHPGLSPDLQRDSAWGVFLSEFVFLPSLNVVLVAFTNLWTGLAAGTAIVTGIEFAFVRVGLFTYDGWRLWGTIVIFPFYFLAVRLYWRQVLRRGMTDKTLQAVTRFCAVAAMVTLMSLTVFASRVTDSSVRLVSDAEGNRSLMRLIIHGVGILLGQWAIAPAQWANRWGRVALTIVGMIIITDAFEGLHLLIFLRPYSGVLDAAGVGLSTILAGVIMDWIAALAQAGEGRRIPPWKPPDL